MRAPASHNSHILDSLNSTSLWTDALLMSLLMLKLPPACRCLGSLVLHCPAAFSRWCLALDAWLFGSWHSTRLHVSPGWPRTWKCMPPLPAGTLLACAAIACMQQDYGILHFIALKCQLLWTLSCITWASCMVYSVWAPLANRLGMWAPMCFPSRGRYPWRPQAYVIYPHISVTLRSHPALWRRKNSTETKD